LTGFQQQGSGNVVRVGAQMQLSGYLIGNHNHLEIGDAAIPSQLVLRVHGHHNRIVIGAASEIKGLAIAVGNHLAAHRTVIRIGDEFTVEAGSRFLLYNSGNVLTIGSRCMFSSAITVRCGESPHLLFDRETGAYLDVSDGVRIGDHVWVGEGVTIVKSVTISDESVVGVRSVVTRRFDESHVAIAGNPARVVRQNVQWIRNPGLLEAGSAYERAWAARQADFEPTEEP
jgi:acetyltransferase-like isoleucine patch superfamily enzyme